VRASQPAEKSAISRHVSSGASSCGNWPAHEAFGQLGDLEGDMPQVGVGQHLLPRVDARNDDGGELAFGAVGRVTGRLPDPGEVAAVLRN